jgi:hypothetical protein
MVFEAHDIALPEVVAGLNFNDMQRNLVVPDCVPNGSRGGGSLRAILTPVGYLRSLRARDGT